MADTFKILAGQHVTRLPNGKLKTQVKGELVSDGTDLCERFPNKFERVHPSDLAARDSGLERAKKAREEAAKVEATLPPEPVEEKVVEEKAPDLGTDVTSKFEAIAADGRLVVYYDGEDYSIADEDGVLGTFAAKNGVVEFFKKWKKSNHK